MKQLQIEFTEWYPLPNFENHYEININGDVRNKKTKKILKHVLANNGYYMVAICINLKVTNLTVHRLKALAFIPRIEGKDFVNHIDGNRLNNDLPNLEWTDRKENILHGVERAKKEGRPYTFQKKNKPEFILLLRAEYANGKGQTEISKEYGIKYNSLGHILKRRTWKSI